ncbi:hypothetical protein [Pseudaeromonas paramecii]|uniref:Uncharacterized protein n=1 Tax=Pseudaeromonas paramecii TaxID=2138166 RepID=A0ABP8QCS7_9GAMM
MMKVAMLALLLALSGYYLAVLYLAAHPKVSLAYRYYYLELKTRFWSRYQTLAYVPGAPMDLVVERVPFLTREGWHIPDETGKGSLLSEPGGLYFILHKVDGPLRLSGTLTVPVAGCTLTVGQGRWQETVKFAEAGSQSFAVLIPSDGLVADPDQPNLVTLSPCEPLYFQSLIMTNLD